MNEVTRLANELFERTPEEERRSSIDSDPLNERIYSIKPPGKGDSGMAEEKG